MDASAWTEKSNEIKQAFLEKLTDAKWQKEKEEVINVSVMELFI